MEMTIRKSEKEKYRYHIECRFFIEKYRQAYSECEFGISAERVFWDVMYSQKFLCFHRPEHVDVPKQKIKELSIKKVYAREFGVTCVMFILLLIFLAVDVLVFCLAQEETEWLLLGGGMFLGAVILTAFWYLISRISVLQIITDDKEICRVPFTLKKQKNSIHDEEKENLLKELHGLGLK